jgi:hypothetical protein
MKFLVLLTPAAQRTLAEFAPYAIEEEIAIWGAYRNGQLRECYFQSSPPEVTLIYEAADVADVHIELDRLPMIKAGLLERRVVHLGPWLPIEAVFDRTIMAPQ